MIIQIPSDIFAMSWNFPDTLSDGKKNYRLLSFPESQLDSLSNEECYEAARKYLDRCLSCGPTALYLNVCYRRSITGSKVFGSVRYDVEIGEDGNPVRDAEGNIKRTETRRTNNGWLFGAFFSYRKLMERGIDMVRFFIDYTRSKGCEAWLSVRMSDHHPSDNMSTHFQDTHGMEEHDGRPDYSQACVRTYYKNYIKELLEDYAPDGIELDWIRTLPVLPRRYWSDTRIISDFMHEIKTLANAAGAKLGARVYTDEWQNREVGMDVCGWIAEGSLDSFTAENFFIPANYEIPVEDWREKIAARNTDNHPYQLYCGCDNGVSCDLKHSYWMTPELIRGFARTCIERGADDVYLFNMVYTEALTTGTVNLKTGKFEEHFEDRLEAARNYQSGPADFMYLSEPRFVYVLGNTPRYPITLAPGESKTVEIYTGKRQPQYRLFVGSEQDTVLEVTLNGGATTPEEVLPPLPDFPYEEGITVNNPFHYQGQLAPCMRPYAANAADVKDGYNQFTLCNPTDTPVSLIWLEVKTAP